MMDGQTQFWVGLVVAVVLVRFAASRMDSKTPFWVGIAMLLLAFPIAMTGTSTGFGAGIIIFVAGFFMLLNGAGKADVDRHGGPYVPPPPRDPPQNPLIVPDAQAAAINTRLQQSFRFAVSDLQENRQGRMSAAQQQQWAKQALMRVIQLSIGYAFLVFIARIFIYDDEAYRCGPIFNPDYWRILFSNTRWVRCVAEIRSGMFWIGALLLVLALYSILYMLYQTVRLVRNKVTSTDGLVTLRIVREQARTSYIITVGTLELKSFGFEENSSVLRDAVYRVYHKGKRFLSMELNPEHTRRIR